MIALLAFVAVQATTIRTSHVVSEPIEMSIKLGGPNLTWPCPPLQRFPPATNVNELRAQDIKVVMALGDSMTAGFAMKAEHAYDIFDLYRSLLEFRGSVFSIGGNDGAATVPNFIAHYRNGEVPVGASVGNSPPLDAIKWEGHIVEPHNPPVDRLNAAQSQAKVAQVADQVDYLVQQLQLYHANGTIDFDNDWKLLTLLTGANNICGSCTNGSIYDPVYFGQEVDKILSEVTTRIPRVFVNVITMFNISQVYTIHETSFYCEFMWGTFCAHECGCLTSGSTPAARAAMDAHSLAFNKQFYALEKKYKAMNNPNFTVSVQPFTQDMLITTVEEVSELDCFHPSLLANEGFAVGLWNNMLLPSSKKSHALSVHNAKILCPTDNTYFQ